MAAVWFKGRFRHLLRGSNESRSDWAVRLIVSLCDNDSSRLLSDHLVKASRRAYPNNAHEGKSQHNKGLSSAHYRRRLFQLSLRLLFPVIPLAFCVALVITGYISDLSHDLLALPSWYICNILLMVYPFQVLHPKLLPKSTTTASVVFVGVAISLVELFLIYPLRSPTIAYPVGNTLYAVLGMTALHIGFVWRASPRVNRAWMTHCQGSSFALPLSHPSISTAADSASSTTADGYGICTSSGSLFESTGYIGVNDGSSEEESYNVNSPPHPTTTTAAAAGGDGYNSEMSRLLSAPAVSNVTMPTIRSDSRVDSSVARRTPGSALIREPKTFAGHIAFFSVGYALIIIWLSYTSQNSDHYTNPHTIAVSDEAFYWGYLYIIFVPVLILCIADHNKSFLFNVSYLVFYNLLCIRLPDFLGHITLRYFSLFADTYHLDQTKYAAFAFFKNHLSLNSTAPPAEFVPSALPPGVADEIALKQFGVTVVYIIIMQLYTYLIQVVTRNMSAPTVFPRFLFIGQMYYYCFWYMILMVDQSVDIKSPTYLSMILLMNFHYILSNTGFYEDVLKKAMSCSVANQKQDHNALLLQFVYRIKLTGQDTLADVISLIAVPSMVSLFVYLGDTSILKESHVDNMWWRFLIMLFARIVSSAVTRFIFAMRIRDLRLQFNVTESSDWLSAVLEADHVPKTRYNCRRYLNDLSADWILWPQAMVHENDENFRRCFWYFTLVAVSCLFAVFQRPDRPARFAFHRV